MNLDAKTEGLKMTPPAVISGLSFFGITVADWVYVLTGIYLILQIVYFIYKFCKLYKKKGDQ